MSRFNTTSTRHKSIVTSVKQIIHMYRLSHHANTVIYQIILQQENVVKISVQIVVLTTNVSNRTGVILKILDFIHQNQDGQ